MTTKKTFTLDVTEHVEYLLEAAREWAADHERNPDAFAAAITADVLCLIDSYIESQIARDPDNGALNDDFGCMDSATRETLEADYVDTNTADEAEAPENDYEPEFQS